MAAEYIKNLEEGCEGRYANVAFRVANTLAENGSVKRGVCFYDGGRLLTKMVESSVERLEDGTIMATPLDPNLEPFKCDPNQLVSMNLFVFSKDIITKLNERFPQFLAKNVDNLKSEYLIPEVVSELVSDGKASLELLETPSVWYGVTYREDKPSVVKALKELTDKGEYKKGLY